MNNSVKNGYGEIVGFRCWQCGGIFNQMWGCICNACRQQNSDNEKLREEIKNLTQEIKTLKSA